VVISRRGKKITQIHSNSLFFVLLDVESSIWFVGLLVHDCVCMCLCMACVCYVCVCAWHVSVHVSVHVFVHVSVHGMCMCLCMACVMYVCACVRVWGGSM